MISLRAVSPHGRVLLVIAIQGGDVEAVRTNHVLSIDDVGPVDEVAIFYDDEAGMLARLRRLGFTLGKIRRTGVPAPADKGVN